MSGQGLFPCPLLFQNRFLMPDTSSAPLCSVFSTYSPIEAHIVSGMLEDSGIECVLSNEFFAAADSPVSNASGGVQVFVRAADADEARALLADTEQPEDTL